MADRLQKILAAAGVASRRAAEGLLRDGRVSVNGSVATLGQSADPAVDVIQLDGESIRPERLDYWILHKPKGVLCTAHDPLGRSSVIDFLPPETGRLYPVGRLDVDSEGLVLLTNDGEVTQALLHPSRGSERSYRVRVRGQPTESALKRLARGVRLNDGVTAPARVGKPVHDPKVDESTFRLTLGEGRNRQIRRALDRLGYPVVRLLRDRMGTLRLGDLEPRRARRLDTAERRTLLDHAVQHGARISGRQATRKKRPRARGRAAKVE